MAPVNGRPFLEYQLDYWVGQGIKRFVLSVGYHHQVITAHFGATYRGIPIEYAIEPLPLGTGGGLLLAAAKLSGNEAFVLLNGDTYFEVDLGALCSFHRARNADWTCALFPVAETGRYMGMAIATDGQITSLASSTVEPNRLANGGVYLITPEVLRTGAWKPGDRVSLEEDILPAVIGSGRRCFGFECRETFIDIGVPDDYFRAFRLLSA